MRFWWTSSITCATYASTHRWRSRPRITACLIRWAAARKRCPSRPAASCSVHWCRASAWSTARACRVRTTCWTRCRPLQPRRNGALAGFQRHRLAAEWGHPSDNLGGIPAVCDWLGRNAQALRRPPPTVHDVLLAMIKAHEIRGVLALQNSFNRVGLDHVVLVKVATTAVVAQLLGLDRERMLNALSLAWVDGKRCAPTGTLPTPARARAGRPAMRPAVACARRSWRPMARWAIPVC